MSRFGLGVDVLQAGYERVLQVYKAGHRVIVSFSGGKDSTVCLELALRAARETNRLPVEVVMQDEEIAYPGTYEFAERTANRPEISMSWLVMQQPLVNIFNRESPYWWVMDPLLAPEDWVRRPPEFAQFTVDKDIEYMVHPGRFPVADVTPKQPWPDVNTPKLVTLVGLRVSESERRAMGISSSGGAITHSNEVGVHRCRPIYDWADGDVWRFIATTKCDYNKAYDTLFRMGIQRARLRVGPPTMNRASIEILRVAALAWPQWFDRVALRLPGIRTASKFGARVCRPHRQLHESWQRCFERECLGLHGGCTPTWIRERAERAMPLVLAQHKAHAGTPLPDIVPCDACGGAGTGSWKGLTIAMWNGDPQLEKIPKTMLPYMNAEFFRPGSGTWEQGIPWQTNPIRKSQPKVIDGNS